MVIRPVQSDRMTKMKHLPIILAVSLAIALPAQTNAQSQNEKYIEVHGNAEEKVTPDRITLSITINENDYRKRSLNALEKEMKKALSDVGISVTKDLKVANLSSSFKKPNAKNQDAVLSKSYTLEVHSAETAAKVISALEDIDVSNVYVMKAEYSGIEALKIAVKAKAMKNAKEIATAMTSAIDQTLGPAIYIYEQESRTDSYRPALMMAKSANLDMLVEESLSEPELEFKEITVTSKVTVRFSL